MDNNIGNTDRFIRLTLGIVLLIIAFSTHLITGWLSYTVIGMGITLLRLQC